jgi:hypothetical protein
MPTGQQIRDEITADPAALGYASPAADRRDNDLFRLMTAKTARGYVPIRDLAAYSAAAGITGGILALDEIRIGEEIAPSVPMTLQTKGLLKTVRTIVQDDYRLEEVDVDLPQFGAALDGLILLGLMTAGDKTAMLAMGANRRSRLDVLGWAIGEADLSAALNGGA